MPDEIALDMLGRDSAFLLRRFMPVVEVLVTLGEAIVSLPLAPGIPFGLVAPNVSMVIAPLLELEPIERTPVDEPPDGGLV